MVKISREPSTRIKDNLGNPDTTFQFGMWDMKETIVIEENSTIVTASTTAGNFILDHPSKGILDFTRLGNNPATTMVVRVINPNNTWRDHIRTKRFYEGASTCTIDTTNFKITF